MKTLLHLSPAGPQYWSKTRAGWQPLNSAPDPAQPVWVVTDLAEESLAEIEIPRLFGSSRAALLDRQLAMRFPDTPYRRCLNIPHGSALVERLAPTQHTLFGIPIAHKIDEELDAHNLDVAALCPTTLLLTDIGCHRTLPPHLLVVLPSSAGLRILYLKNRIPTLTRLTPILNDAKAQAEEIIRTHRYLAHTRALPAGTSHLNILILGPAKEYSAALAQAQLPLLPLPPPWDKAPPTDWRLPLFDLALRKQPYGQLAPLARRTRYMARHLSRMSLTAAALILCSALTATGLKALDLLETRRNYDSDQQHSQRLQANLNQVEQRIAAFGVEPETMRRALELDDHEIANAPAFNQQLHRLGEALGQGRPAGSSLSRIDWHLLAAGSKPCEKYLPATPPGTTGSSPTLPPPSDTPSTPGTPENEAHRHQAEIILEANLPADLSPRARIQLLRELSTRLSHLPGATLLADPLQALARNSLRSGGQLAEEKASVWCLTLADSPNPPNPPNPAAPSSPVGAAP
ncbi:MAG: hypothetical protein KBD39_11135 [Sterolibacterium sp.]|nr:hypothetical protein [Sterolibacterium sp.]